MKSKWRPNVLALAGMATISSLLALWLVLHYLDRGNVITRLWDNPELGVLLGFILGITVGALVGSLLTLAGQVATDPEPPSIPAKEFPDVLRALGEFKER